MLSISKRDAAEIWWGSKQAECGNEKHSQIGQRDRRIMIPLDMGK